MAGLSDLFVNDPYDPGPYFRAPVRRELMSNLRDRLWQYLQELDALSYDHPKRENLKREINSVATRLGGEGADVKLPDWYSQELSKFDKPMPTMGADTPHWARPEMPAMAADTPHFATVTQPGGAGAPPPGPAAQDPLEATLMEQAMAMLNGPQPKAPTVARTDLPDAEQTPLPDFSPIPEAKTVDRLALPEAPQETPPGRHNRPFNMALVETGLRLAASKRANFLGALAEAGLSGMERYSSETDKQFNLAKEGRAETRANEQLQLQNQQIGISRDSNELQRANQRTNQETTRNATDRSNTEARNTRTNNQGTLDQARNIEQARLESTHNELANKGLNASASAVQALANYKNAMTTAKKEDRPQMTIEPQSGNIVIQQGGKIQSIIKLPGTVSENDERQFTGLWTAYHDALEAERDNPGDPTAKTQAQYFSNEILKFWVRKEAEEIAARNGAGLRY